MQKGKHTLGLSLQRRDKSVKVSDVWKAGEGR